MGLTVAVGGKGGGAKGCCGGERKGREGAKRRARSDDGEGGWSHDDGAAGQWDLGGQLVGHDAGIRREVLQTHAGWRVVALSKGSLSKGVGSGDGYT